MFYLFRTTTSQLTGHLEHIEESGDSVLSVAFTGEKHWIIVCRKGRLETVEEQTERQAKLLDSIWRTTERVEKALLKTEKPVRDAIRKATQ